MTKKQLLRFIEIRNKSGFSSNLQFQIDCDEAGFDCRELGSPTRRWDANGQMDGYRWMTDHGTLIEHLGGRMELLEGE